MIIWSSLLMSMNCSFALRHFCVVPRLSLRKNFAHVCLDYINLTVTIDEKSQVLPQKEFQLLYKLLSFPNHTFTRQQIMDELWGYDSETDVRTVDVHINRLRDRFREIPYFQILTVRGLGYKGMIEK